MSRALHWVKARLRRNSEGLSMNPTLKPSFTRTSAFAALLMLFAPAVLAQKSTEMFVPIGQSAGLSGKHTMIARVQSVDAAQRTLTLQQDAATSTVRLGAQTALWIDRSKLAQSNSAISLADVKAGMLAEVKFVKNNRSTAEAEWVKVQPAP